MSDLSRADPTQNASMAFAPLPARKTAYSPCIGKVQAYHDERYAARNVSFNPYIQRSTAIGKYGEGAK